MTDHKQLHAVLLRELVDATLTAALLLALVWGFRQAVFIVLEALT